MKVLLDHNLPPRLARALNTIFEPDDEVIALRDKFGRSDLSDENWITQLGQEGHWVVLSADFRIAKKKPSRDILLSAGLLGLFLSPSMQKAKLERQAARLLTLWPQIRILVSTVGSGVFEVPASGQKFRTIGR